VDTESGETHTWARFALALDQGTKVFSNPGMSLKGVFDAGIFRCLLWGCFHILLVVVAAVEMWESALSISKVCGKGGKQYYRFPGFP
jgi:hypothetical protein